MGRVKRRERDGERTRSEKRELIREWEILEQV